MSPLVEAVEVALSGRCHRGGCTSSAHRRDAEAAVGVFAAWLRGHAGTEPMLEGTLEGLAREAVDGP